MKTNRKSPATFGKTEKRYDFEREVRSITIIEISIESREIPSARLFHNSRGDILYLAPIFSTYSSPSLTSMRARWPWIRALNNEMIKKTKRRPRGGGGVSSGQRLGSLELLFLSWEKGYWHAQVELIHRTRYCLYIATRRGNRKIERDFIIFKNG